MQEQAIKDFLEAIGATNIGVSSGNVVCSCPLAFHTHAKGSDRKPSFGVKISETAPSTYNCFACGVNGTLIDLLARLTTLTGKSPKKAVRIYMNHEVDEEVKVVKKKLKLTSRFTTLVPKQIQAPAAVSPEILKVCPYLNKDDREILDFLVIERRISLRTIAEYRLRKCITPTGRTAIIFPVLAADKRTVLDMWVRMLDDKQFFRLTLGVLNSWFRNRFKNEIDFKATHLCFGNHLYDRTKPVVMVEAPIDAMRLHSMNFKNVVAVNGGLSAAQAKNFYARSVYFGFDADSAGRDFSKHALGLLKDSIPIIYDLDWSKASKTYIAKDPCNIRNINDLMHVFNGKKILKGWGESDNANNAAA